MSSFYWICVLCYVLFYFFIYIIFIFIFLTFNYKNLFFQRCEASTFSLTLMYVYVKVTMFVKLSFGTSRRFTCVIAIDN
jgi:hypothetical protein